MLRSLADASTAQSQFAGSGEIREASPGRSLVLGIGRLANPADCERHAARVFLGLLLDLIDRLAHLAGARAEVVA